MVWLIILHIIQCGISSTWYDLICASKSDNRGFDSMNSFTLVFGSCAKKIQQRRLASSNASRKRSKSSNTTETFFLTFHKSDFTVFSRKDLQQLLTNKMGKKRPYFWTASLLYICLLFSGFPNVCQFVYVNFDMIFLVIGFICLITTIK